jgi:hypothetical protein
MSELDLTIPAGATKIEDTDILRSQQVERRIETMPAFDVMARIGALTQLLHEITCVRLANDVRTTLLERIDREIDDILPACEKEIRHVSFPLPDKAFALCAAIHNLLNEAATGYKLLILDLIKRNAGSDDHAVIYTVFLRCIHYLSQRVLLAYAAYQPADADTWRDLHRLYAYAEKQRIATDTRVSGEDRTVSSAYARVVALALANPYHLMQGEVFMTWRLLKKWSLAVRFERPSFTVGTDGGSALAGRYLCDLASDSPPKFALDETVATAQNVRLLDLTQVISLIDARMKVIALNSRRSLQLRSEWDLLHRLRRALAGREQRHQQRRTEHGTVKVIIGLRSCHHYYSGYQEFSPEQAEVDLHGDDFETVQSLSLVPAEETPWLDNEIKSKLDSGVINPRAYLFDAENRENDIWKKSHTVGPRHNTALEQSVESRTLDRIHEFAHTNNSVGGEGLKSLPGARVQLRVGDLVAAFPQDGDDDSDPRLHIVRWIYSPAQATLSTGLRRIEGEVDPVAVRALGQEMDYRAYARAFLINESKNSGLSIVVPAGLFTFGQTLLLNDGDRLRCIKLENIIENTRAFSQFGFSWLDGNGPAQSNIISSLKQLLKDAMDSG